MELEVHDTEPRVLDTYALIYAFGMSLMVPALFVIERAGFVRYEPGFLALVLGPLFIAIAATFLTDAEEDLVQRVKRIAILTPLILLAGVTILFVAEIVIVLPVSIVLVPENFDVLTPFFAASLALVAAPLLFALGRRIRGRVSVGKALQVTALVTALAIVIWTLAMTLGEGRVLGTFMRRDLLDYFAGSLTWFLPSFGLAAGLWRRIGIV